MSFEKIRYRGHNNYDQAEASNEAATLATPNGPGESMTIQAMAEDADLNVLMKRFGVTGKMPENVLIPEYGDYSEISDYRSAWEAVTRANEQFMTIPADVRAKFDNDPQKYLDFCSEPQNRGEMLKLGLLKPEILKAAADAETKAAADAAARDNPPTK